MNTDTKQTPRQRLASTLRRNEYKGCRGQVSNHGKSRFSLQIFASADEPRFLSYPFAPASTTSRLVLDVNL